VLRAANGKIAIEMIQDNTEIDLVLMDIKMPVMSGEKAAAEIKKRRTNLPIIAQTAYAMEYEVYKYNNIFDDYITKPIQISELKNKLSKYNIV
jgi:CheY-like chemotaxis protein